ncbi:unnamed protein product [Brassica rapa]|uniref:Uncharacterized protein n=1 Tax=Brassica campestris TaxID=3711 RepID=A0A8D9LZD1_BRACM|nr:unnamed protein product [Brassica rapa]
MAQFMKLLVTIALTMAITVAIITTTTTRTNTTTTTFALEDPLKDHTPPGAVKVRPSRFLAEKVDNGQGPKARNPNAADHCNKEPEICSSSYYSTGANSTMACCNNKCMDLSTDDKNCGACKNKCKFGQTCCRGQCVYVAYDKRHCGECNHRCEIGELCVYGLLKVCFLLRRKSPAGVTGDFITGIYGIKSRPLSSHVLRKGCLVIANPSLHGGRGALPSEGGSPSDLLFLAGGGSTFTIKRVPTVVSNHQKDETAEEEGEGFGRNILSKCCINVERLPLYTCKPAEENVTFLESLLLGEWEDRFQRGLFRYDVTACETKVIPGKYGFISQLNEGRHLKKRPTEFRVDKVLQPFDANKFNFTKVSPEELLFQFEADLPLEAGNSPSVVAINVSPIEYGHVLLIPRILDCLPQRIDHKSLLLALHMAVEAANPYFRVGYNSLGAFATINHLHFQAYYLAMPFPIEKAHSLKISTTNDGVRISKLMSYPVRGLLFEGGNSIKELSDTVSNASVCLQNNNIPFNILISDSGKRIFLLPQCYAEKQALGGVSSELLDTQVNPAVWEMSGHMVLKRKKDYEGATEEKAWSLLAEVSLSEERFKEVITMIFEATGCNGEEEEQSSIDGDFIRVHCCHSVKEEAVSN